MKQATLNATLDDEGHAIRLSANYKHEADQAMSAMVKTLEKWTSCHAGATKAPAPAPTISSRPPASAAAIASRLFQGMDAMTLPEITSSSTLNEEETLMPRHLSREERLYFQSLSTEEQRELAQLLETYRKETSTGVPLRFRVLQSRLPDDLKHRIVVKLDRQAETHSSSEVLKYGQWVDCLLQLPLSELVVPQPTVVLDVAMRKGKEHLDRVIFGHRDAKVAILERFYLWLVNPLATQRPLALSGVPGNGKTSLIREGLAAVMARPFAFISLGGSTDASYLLGHGYTYEGSLPGRIVENLVQAKCSNPIFYFDELDKCSATPKGEEIVNVLVHLTDPVQADRFRDRYVGGLDIDLGRALCVFSFNDSRLISPVLLDRLQIVETDRFDAKAQIDIALGHLLPQILKERNLEKDKVFVEPSALQVLLRNTEASGVRPLKAILEQVVTKCCLYADTQDAEFLLPLKPDNVQLDNKTIRVMSGLDNFRAEAANTVPLGMYM